MNTISKILAMVFLRCQFRSHQEFVIQIHLLAQNMETNGKLVKLFFDWETHNWNCEKNAFWKYVDFLLFSKVQCSFQSYLSKLKKEKLSKSTIFQAISYLIGYFLLQKKKITVVRLVLKTITSKKNCNILAVGAIIYIT